MKAVLAILGLLILSGMLRIPSSLHAYTCQTPSTPANHYVTIYGQITDLQSGLPIAGARLALSISAAGVTTTDSLGCYSLTFYSGYFTETAMTITATGYQNPPQQIISWPYVDSTNSTIVKTDLALKPLQSTTIPLDITFMVALAIGALILRSYARQRRPNPSTR